MPRLLQILLSIALSAVSDARGWTVASLPDPTASPHECGRDVAGWVCSPDGLVNQADLDTIQGYITTIYSGVYPYSELTCSEQYTDVEVPVEIMAVIVDQVQGTGDAATKVAAFTKGIHARFGVGDAVCGSGVVLVVSVNDRQVRLGMLSQVESPLYSRWHWW